MSGGMAFLADVPSDELGWMGKVVPVVMGQYDTTEEEGQHACHIRKGQHACHIRKGKHACHIRKGQHACRTSGAWMG